MTVTFILDETGLCGCYLPDKVYKSSESYLTLTFNTVCDNTTVQHGEFEIVISAVKKGGYKHCIEIVIFAIKKGGYK